MEYRHMPDGNFEDLASGRVLYHQGGQPSFPVRLAGELFMRCMRYVKEERRQAVKLYDPCCGGGYLLTVLGLLYPGCIGGIYGSDIAEQAVSLAGSNLSLLTPAGMARRRQELSRLVAVHGKDSHRQALESLARLENRLRQEPDIRVFRRNCLDPAWMEAAGLCADLVITDVPYGNLVCWQGEERGENPLNTMLRALVPVLEPGAVVAVASNKRQKHTCGEFHRLEKFQVGKRRIEILRI